MIDKPKSKMTLNMDNDNHSFLLVVSRVMDGINTNVSYTIISF